MGRGGLLQRRNLFQYRTEKRTGNGNTPSNDLCVKCIAGERRNSIIAYHHLLLAANAKKRGTSSSFPRKRLIKCVPFSTRRKKKRPPLLHSYLAFGKLQALWTKNVLIGDRAQCHLSTVSSPIMPPIAKQMPRTRTLLTALVLLQSNSSVHVFGKESQSHI